MEIEGLKRELNLLPAPLEVSQQTSGPLSMPSSPIQQQPLGEQQCFEAHLDADHGAVDPVRETILQNMTINFDCQTALPKLNSVNGKELNQLVDRVNDSGRFRGVLRVLKYPLLQSLLEKLLIFINL